MTKVNLGTALATLGERESGTARLEEAVAAYRDALQEQIRARVPLEWANTQICLGNALRILGARESGTARLEEAVAAYREALQENTRARRSSGPFPRTISAMRSVCSAGGRAGRHNSKRPLPPIATPCRKLTRARVPLLWAGTQNNLGAALRVLGEREGGRRLEAAVSAYRDALKERTRARVPLYWAQTQ